MCLLYCIISAWKGLFSALFIFCCAAVPVGRVLRDREALSSLLQENYGLKVFAMDRLSFIIAAMSSCILMLSLSSVIQRHILLGFALKQNLGLVALPKGSLYQLSREARLFAFIKNVPQTSEFFFFAELLPCLSGSVKAVLQDYDILDFLLVK